LAFSFTVVLLEQHKVVRRIKEKGKEQMGRGMIMEWTNKKSEK
jgi:hypothetical protein